jgi:hypothetical protein
LQKLQKKNKITKNYKKITKKWHTHFEVREEAEIAKKVDLHWFATAFAIIVFPFPGGPNNNKPII